MEYIYGALLLHKLGQPVNEENLKKVIHAAHVSSGPNALPKVFLSPMAVM